MSLKGLIFDLDGVLTDTAKYHYLAWKKLADELGYYFDEEINELLKGVSRINSFEIILEKNNATQKFSAKEKEDLANKKNEYYKEMIEQLTPNDILDGIIPFITEARNNGVKCAVASISKNANRVLESLKISDMFDYIADAALVKKPKPDPEIFVTCANALGFDANVIPIIPTIFEALSEIEWKPSAITLELLITKPTTILDIATNKLANKSSSNIFFTFT